MKSGRCIVFLASVVLLGGGPIWAQGPPFRGADTWEVLNGQGQRPPVALPLKADPPRTLWLELALGQADTRLTHSAEPSPTLTPGFSFLYRTPQPPEGGSLSAELRFGDKVIPSSTPLAPSTRWQAARFSAQDAWPEGDWELVLRGPAALRVELLLPADPTAKWSPEQALRDLAAYCKTAKRPDEQRIAWESLAALFPRTGKAALALRSCAELLASEGDTHGAVNTYLQALEELGDDLASWRTFPGAPGYNQDRVALDLASRARSRLTELAQNAPNPLAAEAYRAAALEYPLRPTAKAAALGLARILIEADAPADALPWLVLALDQGGDHDPVKAKLRLSHNQVHLDAISKPTDRAVLHEALGLLTTAAGDSLPQKALDELVDAWLAGEVAGLGRDREECTKGFSRAAELGKGTAANPCARIALSQWLQHLGYFIEAERALPDRDDIATDAILQWREFQAGRLLMSQGIFEQAALAFARAMSGRSIVLADHAALYRGECLEFQGLWPQAVRAYQQLSSFASVPDVRQQARFWAHRVKDLAADYTPAVGTRAAYWGEDRQTQGQWDIYGEDLFILCGRMAPGDLTAGPLAPLKYRRYTADPKKHYWWWNWLPVTDHPSVMIDPPRAHATACNWDDGGEKQAIGTGPDLMVDLPIPEGLFRLSLYIVNDFNYYEPNREYTIYLLDEKEIVLAACPVRDFEGGVYYHFAVQGPLKLTIRIFRNLSLNVLLQGVFLDRLDTRTGAMADREALGPWGEILHERLAGTTARPRVELCTSAARREAIGSLLDDPGDDLLSPWQTHRLLNAYGAGRLHEEERQRRMCELVP